MKTIIHSKWHKIADLKNIDVAIAVGDAKNLPNSHNMADYVRYDILEDMWAIMDKLPKYVMYDDIVELVYTDEKSALHQSVETMVKADMAHLPFPDIVVEFTANKYITGIMVARGDIDGQLKVRQFAWLGESSNKSILNRSSTKEYPFCAISWCVIEEPGKKPLAIISPNLVYGSFIKDNGKLGLDYRHHLAPFLNLERLGKLAVNELRRANMSETMWAVSCALTATVALLRTRGVVQEKIEAPAKLNKQRAAAGKPLVRDHTVIRIGHVYDRAGNQVAYNSTGKKMPVHWRAGHIRNQRFGPGRSKSYEVFIEPMLINYNEGDDAPVPMKEVTI